MPRSERVAPKQNSPVAASPRSWISLMENHDQAYLAWRQAGVRDKILIHIDAHDDMWWVEDDSGLTIANFISPALREDLVKEVIWVVPDLTWESPQSLKPLIRRLKKVLKGYPGGMAAIKVERRQISTSILGKPVKVCTLQNLPVIEEPVLLDLDIDYLVIPRACHGSTRPPRLPWRWPGDLLSRLTAHGLQYELVTIAYSVEGGYTPLKWKYLGDDAALRLQGPAAAPEKLRGMDELKVAALAGQRGERAVAEKSLLQCRELLPESAAPDYHLAQLYLDAGAIDKARVHYRRALALDQSYRTPFNSSGFRHYAARRLAEAEQEFRRLLDSDPEDAYAYLGLGKIAARRKRWAQAEAWLNQSLELNGQLVDSYRVLGKVLAGQGRRGEAIAAYEKSLVLALRGHKPLSDYIATESQGLVDPDHFRIHGRLAWLYALAGEFDRAINGYRMSIAKGGDGVFPRARLAHLYLKRHQYNESAREVWQALKIIPTDLGNAVPRLLRRLGRTARQGYRAIRGS